MSSRMEELKALAKDLKTAEKQSMEKVIDEVYVMAKDSIKKGLKTFHVELNHNVSGIKADVNFKEDYEKTKNALLDEGFIAEVVWLHSYSCNVGRSMYSPDYSVCDLFCKPIGLKITIP